MKKMYSQYSISSLIDPSFWDSYCKPSMSVQTDSSQIECNKQQQEVKSNKPSIKNWFDPDISVIENFNKAKRLGINVKKHSLYNYAYKIKHKQET